MVAKHPEAVPLDLKVREEHPVVSPKEAQLLHPDKITNNKDFICAAHEKCEAPITCRCIDKKNKTAAFVEGRQSINKHHPDCKFSDKNTEDEASSKPNYQSTEKQFEDVFTGKNILYLYDTTYKTTKENQKISSKKGTKNLTKQQSTVPSKNTNSLPKQQKQTRIDSLRKQVNEYELNPDEKVLDKKTGNTIKIKNIFIPVAKNILSSERRFDRILIYFGEAYINEPKTEGKDFNIRFSDNVNLKYANGKPAFFIDKETLYKEFPVIMQKWEKNKNMRVNAYIRAHFSINGNYINFDVEKESLPYLFFLTLIK
ncbi:hypothetical protein I6N96_04020 [Enterococcus sp. BWM-S5]|uniref:Uncharacterized protein n=1 Tax=Enterococcus larvae TaxID=2794352 RepID=A0ABS4CGZ8_9ENTE|nr:hypothetical protein [Enterococcus larvae]MBP1045431.1 hypothetical protein [Enterococcus larvae]